MKISIFGMTLSVMCLLLCSTGINGKTRINIAAFTYNLVNGDTGNQYSAITYAVELINKDERILPNHELFVHFYDVTVSRFRFNGFSQTVLSNYTRFFIRTIL